MKLGAIPTLIEKKVRNTKVNWFA